jgi:hypothetical protein
MAGLLTVILQSERSKHEAAPLQIAHLPALPLPLNNSPPLPSPLPFPDPAEGSNPRAVSAPLPTAQPENDSDSGKPLRTGCRRFARRFGARDLSQAAAAGVGGYLHHVPRVRVCLELRRGGGNSVGLQRGDWRVERSEAGTTLVVWELASATFCFWAAVACHCFRQGLFPHRKSTHAPSKCHEVLSEWCK